MSTRWLSIKKPKVSKRKEIIKIRAEINETEENKTIENINELRAGSFKI